MATPATFHNPAHEAAALQDEKVASAYEHGHDADVPPTTQTTASPQKNGSNLDFEKGLQSNVGSTHSDDRTLGDEEAPTRDGVEETDADIVDWDGPDDPENPQNWPKAKKWRIIAVLAAVTLVTYATTHSYYQRNN